MKRSKQAATRAQEYRIIEKMANGSFGVVFKVRRAIDDAVLVMKRIPLQGMDKSERREAAQEMLVMGGLHHPFIVAQRDAFLFNDNDLCLIMDYYDGGDLDAAIAKQRDADVYFDFDQVMLWFVQMLLALHYLHTHGVVHRDMKTHNVFINTRTQSVAVGDFGIAEKIDGEKASAVAAAATWRQHTLLQQQHLKHSTPFPQGARPRSPSSASLEYDTLQEIGGASRGELTPSPSNSPLSGQNNARSARGGLFAMETSPERRELSPPVSGRHRRDKGDHPSGSSGTPSPRQDGGSPLANVSNEDAPRGHGQSRYSQENPTSAKNAAVMKGTPLYMAPEALQGGGNAKVGPTADVWSLGCILYELLCLRHPFAARDIGALVMHVTRGEREPLPAHYPPVVRDLVDGMLTLDPAQRPSCAEVLSAPLVKAYVEKLKRLHVPLNLPSSDEEKALGQQMRQFAGEATSTESALHGQSNVATDARFFRKQVRSPRTTPAEERETVERHRQEAAQLAALNLLRNSESARSSLTNLMGGTYSSLGTAGPGLQRGADSAGTFFVGGTTPFGFMADGAMPIFYGGEGEGEGEGEESGRGYPDRDEHLQRGRQGSGTPSFLRGSGEAGPHVGHGTPGEAYGTGTTERSAGVEIGRDNASPPPRRADDGKTGASTREETTLGDRASVPKGSLLPFVLSGRTRTTTTTATDSSRADSVNVDSGPVNGEDTAGLGPLAQAHPALPPRSRGSQGSVPYSAPREDRDPSPSLQRQPTRRDPTGRPPPARPATDVAADHGGFTASRKLQLEDAHRSFSAASLPGKAEGHPSRRRPSALSFEELFFREHENIHDMRGQPITVIAKEVMRMRARVELAVRERQRMRDAQGYYEQFGEDLVPTMPATFHRVRLPPVEAARRTRDGPPPHEADAPPPDVQNPSHVVQQRATTLSSLQPYLQRRRALVQETLKHLSADTLAAVYAYYQGTNLTQRDPHVVAALVPSRRAWPALPFVEDIVVLDKFLEGAAVGEGAHSY